MYIETFSNQFGWTNWFFIPWFFEKNVRVCRFQSFCKQFSLLYSPYKGKLEVIRHPQWRPLFHTTSSFRCGGSCNSSVIKDSFTHQKKTWRLYEKTKATLGMHNHLNFPFVNAIVKENAHKSLKTTKFTIFFETSREWKIKLFDPTGSKMS